MFPDRSLKTMRLGRVVAAPTPGWSPRLRGQTANLANHGLVQLGPAASDQPVLTELRTGHASLHSASHDTPQNRAQQPLPGRECPCDVAPPSRGDTTRRSWSVTRLAASDVRGSVLDETERY